MIKVIKDNIEFINKTYNLISTYWSNNIICRIKNDNISDKLGIKGFLFYSFLYPNKNICFDIIINHDTYKNVFIVGPSSKIIFNYFDKELLYINIFIDTLYSTSIHIENLNKIKKNLISLYDNNIFIMIYIKIIYEYDPAPNYIITHNRILQTIIDNCKRFTCFIFINDFIWKYRIILTIKLVSSNNIILHKVTSIDDYDYYDYNYYYRDNKVLDNHTLIFNELLYNFLFFIIRVN